MNPNWSAIVAWIAFGVAIITPAVTTYLNNRFQLKMRKLEFAFQKQNDYYEKQRSCIENFLSFASKQIETNYQSERIEFLKCYHELLLYLPSKDWEKVKSLYHLITKGNKEQSIKLLYEVTEILAARLKESLQKLPI